MEDCVEDCGYGNPVGGGSDVTVIRVDDDDADAALDAAAATPPPGEAPGSAADAISTLVTPSAGECSWP